MDEISERDVLSRFRDRGLLINPDGQKRLAELELKHGAVGLGSPVSSTIRTEASPRVVTQIDATTLQNIAFETNRSNASSRTVSAAAAQTFTPVQDSYVTNRSSSDTASMENTQILTPRQGNYTINLPSSRTASTADTPALAPRQQTDILNPPPYTYTKQQMDDAKMLQKELSRANSGSGQRRPPSSASRASTNRPASSASMRRSPAKPAQASSSKPPASQSTASSSKPHKTSDSVSKLPSASVASSSKPNGKAPQSVAINNNATSEGGNNHFGDSPAMPKKGKEAVLPVKIAERLQHHKGHLAKVLASPAASPEEVTQSSVKTRSMMAAAAVAAPESPAPSPPAKSSERERRPYSSSTTSSSPASEPPPASAKETGKSAAQASPSTLTSPSKIKKPDDTTQGMASYTELLKIIAGLAKRVEELEERVELNELCGGSDVHAPFMVTVQYPDNSVQQVQTAASMRINRFLERAVAKEGQPMMLLDNQRVSLKYEGKELGHFSYVGAHDIKEGTVLCLTIKPA